MARIRRKGGDPLHVERDVVPCGLDGFPWMRTIPGEAGAFEVFSQTYWEEVPVEVWEEVSVNIADDNPRQLVKVGRHGGTGILAELPIGCRWEYERDCTGAVRLVVQRLVER